MWNTQREGLAASRLMLTAKTTSRALSSGFGEELHEQIRGAHLQGVGSALKATAAHAGQVHQAAAQHHRGLVVKDSDFGRYPLNLSTDPSRRLTESIQSCTVQQLN